MKSLKLITTVILGLLFLSATVAGQDKSKEEKKKSKDQATAEGYENMKKLIHGGIYEFSAVRAYPTGGSAVSLTTNPNHLIVNIYEVDAYLPFYGTSHQATLSGETGIKFKGTLKNLIIEEKESKQMVIASFDVSSGGLNKFMLEVYPSGETRLVVIPSNKSTISYQGRIQAIEEEEDEEKK